MATVIGTVIKVTGMAIVVDTQGNRHQLRQGEALHAGERVITANGASVNVKMLSGEVVNVAESQTIKITQALAESGAEDVTENAVNQAVMQAVLAAVSEGRDIAEVLEDAAAGLAGSDGNATFVNLDRIKTEAASVDDYDGGNAIGSVALLQVLENYIYFPIVPIIGLIEPGQPGPGDDGVMEGRTLVFTVTLSSTTQATAIYSFSLGGGTALAADFGSPVFSNGVTFNAATGFITVPVGVSSFTVSVTTIDDMLVESNETLPLTIGGVTGIGVIVDNDRATITSVTAGPNGGSVEEGNALIYTVTLSEATNVATSYSFSLGGGTASAADYGTPVFSHGVTFNAATGLISVPAGVSSFTVSVPTVDDTLVEPSEALSLTIGGKTGTGIIMDNDGGIKVLNGSQFAVSEEGLPGGIKDTTGDTDTTDTVVATGTFRLAGTNIGAAWSLEAPTSVLTSGGVAVTWTLSADGQVLVGTAGNATVITITINNNGQYTITLSGPIGHADPATEDTTVTNIKVKATVNGVTQTTSLPVTIEDDAPSATGGSATVTPGNTANVAPVVMLASGGNLLGLIGLSALNLIDLGTRSAFGATDANNNISRVELHYQSLLSLGTRQFTLSQALATELGLKVEIVNDPGVLGLIAPSSRVVITSLDGGPIENLAVNELLATARLSGGPLSAEVLNGTSITVTDTQGASSTASVSTLVDANVLSSERANPNLKEGDAGANALNGTNGDDQLYGYAGNDILNGGDGNDIIRGGDGHDVVNGESGNDIVLGGSGADLLTGGQGRDIFRWEAGDQGSAGNPAIDTITDFVPGTDVLDLRSLLQGESQANLSSYIRVTIDANGNTVLHISSGGGFSGGYSAAAEDQRIVLQGVNLQTTYGTTDSAQIVSTLVSSGNLAIDPVAASASGSLGALGADGGFVQSISIDGSTYTFNPVTGNISVTGLNRSSYDVNSRTLTITTTKGTLLVDMDDGTFSFSPKNTTDTGTISFDYTLSDQDGDTSAATYIINVGNHAPAAAAPEVSAGTATAGLITLPGLLNIDLLSFSGRQTFTASDSNNNIKVVIIDYSTLINVALSANVLTYSESVANELGLRVTYSQNSGLLGIVGSSGQMVITAADGGTVDNLALNEFLSTVSVSPQLVGVNVLDRFTIQATDSDNLQDTASTSNLVSVDLLENNPGTPVMEGDNVNNTLIGTADNDIIYGYAGNDTLSGGRGNDILRGGVGEDTLNGGAGNDILIGGKGQDILVGGLGTDVFKWGRGDSGIAGSPVRDTISDFDTVTLVQGGDVLDVRDLLQGENTSNLVNYLHFESVGSDTIIHISANGGYASDTHHVSGNFSSGNTTQQIVLTGIDLTRGQTSDAAIIANLTAQQKLVTDEF